MPRFLAGLVAVWAVQASAASLGTSFEYRGHLLNGGGGASGVFDFSFTVYDAPTNGNTVAGPLRTNALAVSSGGFATTLDFGPIYTGKAYWLGVEVGTNGASSLTPLLPCQPMPISLQALFALNSSNAAFATMSGSAQTAQTASNAWYATTSGTVQSVPNSALPTNVVTTPVSFATNATLGDSLRVTTAGIADYGLNRYGWPTTLATLATNGLFRLWMVGNGWATDGEFAGVFTNLLSYKPFAGYGSSVSFLGWDLPYGYGPFSGNDTAVYHVGDDTNWHQAYFSLEQPGQISAPCQIVVSDVATISYLASPIAGSFAVEIRTNGAAPYSFLQMDATWTSVATVNASNATRAGMVVAWTNTTPQPMQVRVRSLSPGSTPILDFAQWDSTVTSGVVLGMYSHTSSGNWWTYTDPSVVFPIWRAQAPTMVLWTGGFLDSRSADLAGTVALLRSGLPAADLVDIGGHEVTDYPLAFPVETAYCWSNGVPFLNGAAASSAVWGSVANGTAQGLYLDSAHLTEAGYAIFSGLVWSWLGLTADFPSPTTQANSHSGQTSRTTGSALSLTPADVQAGALSSPGGITLANAGTIAWSNPPAGVPAKTTAPSGWIAVTNGGERVYLPFYR